MCDRTVEHCRGNDIKFNWRSSIKLAIKTAWTQRIPARLTFYGQPNGPPLSPTHPCLLRMQWFEQPQPSLPLDW